MPASNPLFSSGFPPEQATPQELDSIGSRIAMSTGVADNARQRLEGAAKVITDRAEGTANLAMARLMEPVEDLLATATTTAGQAASHIQAAAINALQSPLKAALPLGYVPQGTPVYGLAKARKGRSKAKQRPQPMPAEGLSSSSGEGFPLARPGGPNGAPPPTKLPPPGLPPHLPPGLPPSPPGFPPSGCEFVQGQGIDASQPVSIWYVQIPSGAFAPGRLYYLQPPTPGIAPPAQPGLVFAGTGPSVAAVFASGHIPPLPWDFPGSPSNIPASFACVIQVPPPSLPPAVPPPAPPPGGQTCVSICNWPPGLGSPPPAPPPPPPPPCPPCTKPPKKEQTCTIPWLSLHHPHFVLAERAAAKTDYDILVDAAKLGLCTQEEGAEMPACSMPMLSRELPAFVEAGQAQGLTDDQILRSAIAIGLCSKPEAGVLLGEEAVTEIAPESAQQLEDEYDPPTAIADNGGATGHIINVDTSSNDYCWQVWVIPGPQDISLPNLSQYGECLVGWDRAAWGIIAGLAEQLVMSANCEKGSITQLLGIAANKVFNENTWWSKIIYNVSQTLNWIIRELAANGVQVENWISQVTGCGSGESSAVIIAGLLIGAIDKWVLTLPKPLKSAMDAVYGMSCPAELPTPIEANALYATNFISKAEWECVLRREGMMLSYQNQLVKASQRRPSDDELLLLQRKATFIISETDQQLGPNATAIREEAVKELETLGKLYEHNGWTDTKWWKQWQAAQQWVPSPTDAIAWMLKDTEDAQIQDTFKLSAEFTQKFTGHVAEVFAWNGISVQDASYLWKAHWRNMAPHTLYELHKRLRPGWTELMTDAEVTELAAAICPRLPPQLTPADLAARPVSNGFPIPTYCEELATVGVQRAWLESLGTTGYHVSEALGQDDFPPFWRQRLLAVSYNVVTRTDAKRAYETNQIDLDRLGAILQDRGYSPGDAVRMAKFYDVAAVQLHSRRPVCNQWVKSGYDPKLLRQSLETQGMRPDQWDRVFPILQARRAIVIQNECIDSARRNYLSGLVTEQDTRLALAGLKLDNKRINELIAEWNCLKKARPKLETAAEICLYYKTGLVGAKQAKQLLRDLGYTAQQAVRILSLCYLKPLPRGYKKVGDLDDKDKQDLLEALNA